MTPPYDLDTCGDYSPQQSIDGCDLFILVVLIGEGDSLLDVGGDTAHEKYLKFLASAECEGGCSLVINMGKS